MTILVRKADQHVRCRESGKVAVTKVEVALAGDRTEVLKIPQNALCANLDGVVTKLPVHRVAQLNRVLRHGIQAVVASVVNARIAAD